MSNVFFISDLHIGHKRILDFSGSNRYGSSIDEHDEWLVRQWNSVVNRKDLVWVLGDVCFQMDKMPMLDRMKGRKVLVRGNHDVFDLGVYLKYFSDVHGVLKKYGMWLTHAPIHPDELRGRPNVHGHVHMNTIKDNRYVNVCVEMSQGVPRDLEKIRSLVS